MSEPHNIASRSFGSTRAPVYRSINRPMSLPARPLPLLAPLLLGASTPLTGEPPDGEGHWAFQPVTAPPSPEVQLKTWPKGEIDHFVLARQEAAGLRPAPEADRRSQIRRLYFDLLGLPPESAAVRAFEGDTAPDAYEKLVDSLLASPHFGERWARHWLDVARYADTKGYTFEESREYPYAYTYRDWTIRAFNADLPFDKFLIYQIAADQTNAGDEHLAAMGFLTVGRRFLNAQQDIIDDRIDVTFRGTMALTVACARCHDHFYDPVPTADYYSLYGIFASSREPDELPALPDAGGGQERKAFEKGLAERQAELDGYLAARSRELRERGFVARYLLAAQEGRELAQEKVKQLAAQRGLLQSVTLGWRDLLAGSAKSHHPVFAPWHAIAALPEGDGFRNRAAEVWQNLRTSGQPLNGRLLAVAGASPPVGSLEELAALYAQAFAEPQGDAELATVLAAPDSPANVPPGKIYPILDTKGQQRTRRLRKKVDDFKASHPGAPPRAMVMLDRRHPADAHIFERGDAGRRGAKVPRQFPAAVAGAGREPYREGSGRLGMARDIASPRNPLTARVWANRVWGHLLGSHLVATPSDFGLRSDPPTHPLLLDHLASRLVAEGWSTKRLIRSIVTSATYRQSSFAAAAVDPENRLLSHANRKRLDFESLRDGILAVSGQLDRHQFDRPVDIAGYPYSTRRTIYGKVARQNLPAVFRTFDFASPDVHIPKRAQTTVPQQALYMLNGRFARDAARTLASELTAAARDEDKIRALYHRVLARDPSAEELADGLAFVGAQTPEPDGGRWAYGYGGLDVDSGTVAFKDLPICVDGTWQGGERLPDPQLGWTSIHRGGGHPDGDGRHAIWRWRAPADGLYQVRGTITRPSPQGDGVSASLVGAGGEALGSWSVAPGAQVATGVGPTRLGAGEPLYFIVAPGGDHHFDSFGWNPEVQEVGSGRSWSAAGDSRTRPAPSPNTLWEHYAQALLACNEFAFID